MLNRAIVNIVSAPETQKQLATLGYDAVGSTPEDFAGRIKEDTEKWATVIRAANIKTD
jgi:tripartite-type tricarboxylate transporter receptor subunit TctC